ncbi:MAG: DUF1573 domain-containing protein [Candidatus Zixiibacteriota bacterium]|nr:MAG: DUF1573 domain-containing protein [candidate division Zixibacteria bacterium]
MIKTGFLLLLLILISTTVSVAGPEITIPVTDFDFGKTVQRTILTHDFWIKSTGDEPLEILHVEPGCGCTQSWMSDTVIAPGDSARLHIVFSTGRFRGNVAKRPYLLTNVSDEKVYLKIFANLIVDTAGDLPAAVVPPIVDVSQFGDKPRRRARFTLENKSTGELKVSVADSSGKSFTVKLPHEIKGGESIEGLITVDEDRVETGFEESITIELTGTERVRYSVPVRRMFKGKITAEPGSGH